MSKSEVICMLIGNSARYLSILFIGFLFVKIYFPDAENYIYVKLFFIITVIFMIFVILLEKKFMSHRYEAYLGKNKENGEVPEEYVKEEMKISLSKKEIFKILPLSVIGMMLTYYGLHLNYELPQFLLLIISLNAGILIAFIGIAERPYFSS